jgi:hypothetical protein
MSDYSSKFSKYDSRRRSIARGLNPERDRKFLTFDEMREVYNLSRTTAYRLTASGSIPCVRVAGRPLKPMQFDPEVLERVFTSDGAKASRSLKTEEAGDLLIRRRPIPKKEKLCL